MTPLERASRVSARFAADEQYGSATTDADRASNEADWQAYLTTARAVIQAIREPGERVLAAGAHHGPWDEAYPDASDNARDVWVNMIDALLAEEG